MTTSPDARTQSRAIARAAALFALVAAGCGSSVNWRNHIAFRSTGTQLNYSTWEEHEIVDTAISTNLHYVTISLDAVFFRNLPGIGTSDVAFGFDITGVLGDGKAIKTVLDTRKGAGENSFLNFDNLVVIEPFLYKGENVSLNFQFTAVPGSDANIIKAQLQGPAGDAIKRINPFKTAGVDVGMNIYSQVFGFRAKSWQYSFAMFPADRVYRDKPDLLFTAGRHILIAVPPADAPAPFKRFSPSALYRDLKMRGSRLVWAKTDEDFADLPYIVLNITRYKRYPKEDTELRKALKSIDAHIENGSLELASSSLVAVGALINADPIITATEKNLERTMTRWREERIKTAMAKKNGKHEEELAHIKREVDHLFFTLKEFHKILEPYETKDLFFRVNERFHRADELVKQVPDEGQAMVKYKAALRVLAALVDGPSRAPKPPLIVGTAVAPPQLPPPPIEQASILKKWWFWTAIGVGVAGSVAAAVLLGSKTEVTKPGF